MSAVVLDAGALIALERNDRPMWARLLAAASSERVVLVATTALAEVWRGQASQARLSRALAHCELAPFDREARAVGELCGRARTSDICDAHVAIVAARSGDVLYTSDPDDLEHLLEALGPRRPRVVRC